MISLLRYETLAGPCEYLSGQIWKFDHEIVASLSAAEYQERLHQGWRRFGHLLFRPTCANCTACRSLRVDVARFQPNRSQRRNRRMNEGDVRLKIGQASATRAKLDLYDRYHAFQSGAKGWPEHERKNADDYADGFVHNPFPIEEWRYFHGDQLVGVGYVDPVPDGLSAVYFIYEPTERHRGLGTWNVLCAIERAADLGLPYVYLGYFVAGSVSLAYKANFRPHQLLGADGVWRDSDDKVQSQIPNR